MIDDKNIKMKGMDEEIKNLKQSRIQFQKEKEAES